MLEVPPGTLRSWEDRYALVVPERGEGGHRLYSRDQLEQLRFVVAQMGTGVSAADAHRVLAERMGEDGSRWLSVPQTAARVVILLAERDPYAAEFSDYFLRTEGYEVVTTLDAQDAEAQYEDRTPQVVVVDLQISGGAGPALCRAFKDGGARSWPFRPSGHGTRHSRAAPMPSCRSRWTRCSSSRRSRTCS